MSTRTEGLNTRPSMASLAPRRPTGGAGLQMTNSGARPSRPCANCTCSPGLLSRQGRRSSLFLKQLENNRRRKARNSTINEGGSTGSESVYSSDSLCQSTREMNTTGRLLSLRKLMREKDICCYIVPSEDEHQSEYVSFADERRAFISGFTGSAGVACITRNLLNFNENDPDGKSVLSTDGRYFNQASQELDFNWTLLRQGEDKLTWQQWCIREAKEMSLSLGGKTVNIGVDPKLISFEQVKFFESLIKAEVSGSEKASVALTPVEENLIDRIWSEFEPIPDRELNDLLLLNSEYHGEDYKDKKSRLLQTLHKNYQESQTLAVVALDEICWFLNLRGSDIQYNPVFYAYLLIQKDATTLFTDNNFSDNIGKYLKDNEIVVKPYQEVWAHLQECCNELSNSAKSETFLVPDTASWQLIRKISATRYKMIHSPIDSFKSIKNINEIRNARSAQVKEAVCLAQYFAWLEDQLVKHESLIDEYNAAKKLDQIRKTQKHYMGNSFETISSTGANAAVIHYSPPEEGSSMIDPSKIYLCDCGSQFMEGTTDITRTIHLTTPSKEEINNYTLVLKGNLAVERLVFPEGTTGFHIDAIARQFLWAHGLDYRHGTGHGIGAFLNVHEGPVGIGARPSLLKFPLKAGNIISNEPGFYKDGEYGIRIENDILVKESAGLQFGDKKFLSFENLTMVPYCKKLINVKLLSKEEKTQINDHHARIWTSIRPFLQPQSIAFKWLKRETTAL